MAAINLDISTKLDITCRRNDTFSLELSFSDDTGEVMDLSTYSEFKMEVRRHERKTGTATLALTKTGGHITALSNGKMTISAIPSLMNISGGEYVYDLQATASGGSVFTWLRGKFIINEDITI